MYRINQIAKILNCAEVFAAQVLSKISHMDLSEMSQEEFEFWVNYYSTRADWDPSTMRQEEFEFWVNYYSKDLINA